ISELTANLRVVLVARSGFAQQEQGPIPISLLAEGERQYSFGMHVAGRNLQRLLSHLSSVPGESLFELGSRQSIYDKDALASRGERLFQLRHLFLNVTASPDHKRSRDAGEHVLTILLECIAGILVCELELAKLRVDIRGR